MTIQTYTTENLDQAARALKQGALLLVPTDTVYGLAGRFGDHRVLENLKRTKGRDASKPIPVAVSSMDMARRITELDRHSQALMEAFLPGALSLILQAKDIDPAFANGGDTLSIRIPDHPLLLRLIELLDEPLFLTSANVSGQPEAKNFQEALELPLNVQGIVKGTCDSGLASTIVDARDGTIRLLRKGPVDENSLKNALKIAV